MKTTWIIYALAWLLPIMLIVLYLTGIIPSLTVHTGETLVYLLSVTTVVLSLLTAWLAMRIFAMKPVKMRMQMLKGKQKETSFQVLSRVRILMVLMVIIIDFAAYYITGSTSPLYLAAIMGVALIFCWPRTVEH